MSVMKMRVLLFLAAAALLPCLAACRSQAVKFDGGGSYEVTLIGDIHYDAPEYHINTYTARQAKLHFTQWQDGTSRQVLAAAAGVSGNVLFVVQLGDMIQGDCDNLELQGMAYQAAFAELKKHFAGKKILAVRGNHEHRGKNGVGQAPDKYLLPLLKKELGRDVDMDGTNYAVCYGKDLYIFYDYCKKNSGEFVKKTISEYGNSRHIFFITHLPMFPCSFGNPGWVVPQFRELIPLLAKHKAIVLCAHTHFWGTFVYKCDEGTLPQLIVSSMGNNWEPGAPMKKRYSSYDEWKRNIRQKYYDDPNCKWSIDNLKFFKNSDFIHYQSYLANPSGFVKLEVTDSKVTAHIFTDSTGKPVKSVILKGDK